MPARPSPRPQKPVEMSYAYTVLAHDYRGGDGDDFDRGRLLYRSLYNEEGGLKPDWKQTYINWLLGLCENNDLRPGAFMDCFIRDALHEAEEYVLEFIKDTFGNDDDEEEEEVPSPKNKRATEIVLELIRDVYEGYGHNDEVHIYTAEEIEEDAIEWCQDNSDLYDEPYYALLMVEKAKEAVDFEEIAKIITEEKKKETLEYQKWVKEEEEKEKTHQCHSCSKTVSKETGFATGKECDCTERHYWCADCCEEGKDTCNEIQSYICYDCSLFENQTKEEREKYDPLCKACYEKSMN